MTTRNRRFYPLLAALALATAACGEAPARPIGIKEYPGDIAFGDQSPPPPPTVPPAAAVAPAFPGFIVPPAARRAVTGPRDPGPDGEAAPELPAEATPEFAIDAACPDSDPLAVPADEAQGFVPAPPVPATIPYRVAGFQTVDGKVTALPREAAHRISSAAQFAPSSFRFDVGIKEGSAETITTYQVDQRGAGNSVDGISIVQIRTSDQVATDAFTPSAPIRILPLPPVKGQRFSSSGGDPLHGTAITIFGQVVDKTRVNACGVPLEAWLVAVGSDPQTGRPSSIQGPDKNHVLTGNYAVATQFGGLVVSDDLTMDGMEAGRRFTKRQASAINRRPARSGGR